VNLAFDIFPSATPLGTRLVQLTSEQLGVGSGLRVELSGNGSGRIVMNRNQPEVTAANFAADNFVQVFDVDLSTTVPLGGFFLDDSQVQILSTDEEGGETIQFGGPGAITYMSRAVLDKVNYVHFGDDANFGPQADGLWHWYDDQYGDILKRMVDEAQDSDRPAAGHGIDELTYDWDSTTDSAGNAWDSFSGEYTLPIGINYLDIVQRFRDLGLTILMSGELLLQGYQGFFGTDRTSATFAAGKVRLVNVNGAAGANIQGEVRRELKPSLPLSRVLVRGDSNLPADVVTRTAGSYGVVREGFVEYPHSHVTSVLDSVGDQALLARSDAADQPFPKHLVGLDSSVGLYSPFPPEPSYVDATYWLGDMVRVHTGTEMGDYNEANLRVYAINWSLDEDGNW
jgi:hypothetical protein